MGVSLVVFVEARYEFNVREQSTDGTPHWATEARWLTEIKVMWPRHFELLRLMGRPSSDDGWVMYPLRGLPPDASDEAKEYIGESYDLTSWLTAQELFYLQEALAYPEQMPSFHATVAFVKEYLKHDTPLGQMRIVYYFSQ